MYYKASVIKIENKRNCIIIKVQDDMGRSQTIKIKKPSKFSFFKDRICTMLKKEGPQEVEKFNRKEKWLQVGSRVAIYENDNHIRTIEWSMEESCKN